MDDFLVKDLETGTSEEELEAKDVNESENEIDSMRRELMCLKVNIDNIIQSNSE